MLSNERQKEYHYLRKITDQVMQSVVQLVQDVRSGFTIENFEEGVIVDK
jgi:hypothetical protein